MLRDQLVCLYSNVAQFSFAGLSAAGRRSSFRWKIHETKTTMLERKMNAGEEGRKRRRGLNRRKERRNFRREKKSRKLVRTRGYEKIIGGHGQGEEQEKG